MSKKLKVNTDVWPRDDHSKEPDEPLEIRTTYGQYPKDENKVSSVQIESNTTVTYPSGTRLHPKEYCLKHHIYEEVQSLSVDANDANKVLLASYGEAQEPDKKYDLENKLFYNIGTGAFSSIFKKFPKQVAFKKTNYNPDDEESSYRYLYKYEIISENTLKTENKLVEWKDVPIGDTLPDKPDRYYAAIRNHSSEIIPVASLPAKAPFGIKIILTVPNSKKSIHPVSVMKRLLDGVICAFHGEDREETKKAVRERFQKNGLNEDKIGKFFDENSEQLNLFGNRNYLTKSSRWNPEDDRLQFGWIVVNCEGKEYKMSGSIYSMESTPR